MGSKNSKKERIQNRFKDLVKQKGITPVEFQEKVGRAEQTFDGYMKGDPIPIEVALKLANEYGVSLDWFYCRNTFFSELDIMVSILFALDKVFKFRRVHRRILLGNGTPYEDNDMALFIDKRFYNFIVDIQELENLKFQSRLFTQKDYEAKRAELYEKHREYLHQIFESDAFNMEKAIKIENPESLTIIDILANAIGN